MATSGWLFTIVAFRQIIKIIDFSYNHSVYKIYQIVQMVYIMVLWLSHLTTYFKTSREKAMTQESKQPIPEHMQQASNMLAVINISIDIGTSFRQQCIRDGLEHQLSCLFLSFSDQTLQLSQTAFMAFCHGLMVSTAIDSKTFLQLSETCREASRIISAKPNFIKI